MVSPNKKAGLEPGAPITPTKMPGKKPGKN